MAGNNGPKIVTSGLVLALDAADRKSYPSGATTWTDLSGSRNNVSLLTHYGAAVPVYSTSNGGYFNVGNTEWFHTVYGQATLSSSLKPTSITIEAWVYTGTVITNCNETIISVQKGTGEVYSYWMRLLGTRFGGEIATSTGGANAYSPEDVPVIATNTWYHPVMTYNGTTLKTYVNGIERASTALSGNMAYDASNTKMLIGARYAGSGYDAGITQWWGNARPNRGISIVRIYNRALTATEVTQNFNAARGRFNI